MSGQRRQPEQQPPPVQRLQVRYAKRGRARFASHRDVARALERALRRAAVPMATTSGYTPHPRISYANAAPTGAATEAEYLELALRRQVDPEELRLSLEAALPDGLHVLEVVEASGGLAERLTASQWLVTTPGVSAGVRHAACVALLAQERLEVNRLTKAGPRDLDVRHAVVRLQGTQDDRLDVVVRHGAPIVRPDDVVAALRLVHAPFVLDAPAVATRWTQGEWDGERVVGPFEARRSA